MSGFSLIATSRVPYVRGMRPLRIALGITLVATMSLMAASPGWARSHGRRQASASSTPANAGAAVCRSRARDYAYDKHADVGQERMFFDKCMGK